MKTEGGEGVLWPNGYMTQVVDDPLDAVVIVIGGVGQPCCD